MYLPRSAGHSVQFSSVTQSLTLCDPMNRSMDEPCPSPTPGVYPNSCPLSWWCHPTISSSVIPFSSHLQSFPASGSFPMSQHFAWGGKSIGVSALVSVPTMNTQDWSPSEWTGWISLQSKGLSRVFSNSQFSRSVVSDSLQPHESQHARPPCPSPTPGVHSDSPPSSQWCHPAISSSVIPFSSWLQSLPASGSFQMSHLFTSGGQSTGVSASTLSQQKFPIFVKSDKNMKKICFDFLGWIIKCMLPCQEEFPSWHIWS